MYKLNQSPLIKRISPTLILQVTTGYSSTITKAYPCSKTIESMSHSTHYPAFTLFPSTFTFA